MKYALISDIHANLPALEAVLADIAKRPEVAATCHLGDLVGYAPWPNEVVALLRDSAIAGVAGNYDSTVGTDYKHCGCRYEDPHQEELSHLSYDWTRKHVSPTTKQFLAGLPFRVDRLPNGGHLAGPRVVLVHGTPTLNTLYWAEDRPDEFCLKMAQHAGAKSGDGDRLRAHSQAVVPGDSRDSLREYRERGKAQGRRLAGGICGAHDGRRNGYPGIPPGGVRPGACHVWDQGERIAPRVRRVSADRWEIPHANHRVSGLIHFAALLTLVTPPDRSNAGAALP